MNAAAALLPGVRILIVDDHLDTLELMEMVLTQNLVAQAMSVAPRP